MAERSDIVVGWYVSPRSITVARPSVELSVQDLHDTARAFEYRPDTQRHDHLIDSAGKEDLGGGVLVGITSTLNNAYIQFEGRTASSHEGTVTTQNSAGSTLYDSAADFSTANPGDVIINFNDRSVATIIEVNATSEISCTTLEDGTDNQFDIGDGYKIWPIVECSLTGGNIVAVDANGDSMSPLLGSPFVLINRASSSSATISEQTTIQQASFEDGVAISTSGVSGTAFDIGTKGNPSNNLTDALTILTERGFSKIYVRGNWTFGATDNIDNLLINGESHALSTITITSGCSTEGTQFETCTLQGTLSGEVHIHHATIAILAGFKGDANDCKISSNMTLSGTSSDDVTLIDCYSGVPGSGTPEIDMGGDGPGLGMRHYSGGVLLKNKTGTSAVSVDMVSGQVKLTSTVTGTCTIVVRGVGKLTQRDEGPNVTVQNYGLIVGEDINNMMVSLALLESIERGEWKIDTSANQMVFYNLSSVEVARFDLFGSDGVTPTTDDVYRRVPV